MGGSVDREGVSPIGDEGGRSGRRRAVALVAALVVAVASYAAWGLVGLASPLGTDEGPLGVAYRYVGLPGWLIFLSYAGVRVVRDLRSPRPAGRRALGVVLLLLIAATAFMFVVRPLLDVPYLFDPAVVELHDVRAESLEGELGATYYLTGEDGRGRTWWFRVNPSTYRSWDPELTTATLTGLPNTQVTLSIDSAPSQPGEAL